MPGCLDSGLMLLLNPYYASHAPLSTILYLNYYQLLWIFIFVIHQRLLSSLSLCIPCPITIYIHIYHLVTIIIIMIILHPMPHYLLAPKT